MRDNIVFTMTNDELAIAIATHLKTLISIGTSWPHHNPTLDHYKALLKEQERRAKERDIEITGELR